MQRVTRRKLLKRSARSAAVIAGSITLVKPTFARLGANEEIQIGVVGFYGQGRRHITNHQQADGVRVVALCDVDERIWQSKGQKTLEEAGGATPVFYRDIGKMLENKTLDAISIATCNHWHALATIWACQAGKDVYVEKPASHTFFEGRKMVEAARKYDRIVQHGTQSRSIPVYRDAIARIRAGEIGKVYMAKGMCYKDMPGWKTRGTIGFFGPEPPPKGLHFDTWLGPAPKQPFHKNLVHYRWHWFWDFGNGDMGNQGMHELDKARWGMGKDTFPVQITGAGGRFVSGKDQGETPNVLLCTFKYEDGSLLVFETRGLESNDEGGERLGNIFYGSDGPEGLEGWMTLGEQKPHLRDPDRKRELKLEPVGGNGNPNIFHNFHDAMRSRKVADLNSDIKEGHISSGTMHLGNIAYRLGRTLRFDPQAERFIDDAKANEMLTRKPRPPFAVPDEV